MMRSTWKRALSTLLTIAMMASLVIVPASAAAKTYTLDDLGTVFTLGGTASNKSGFVQLEKNEASWIVFEVTGTDASLEVTAASTNGTNKSNFILKQVGEGDALTAVTDVAKKDENNENITITSGDVEVTGQSSDMTVVYSNLEKGTYRVIGSCTGRATRITGLSLTETDGKTYCTHENTTTADDTPATCTTAGKKGDKTCNDCEAVLEEGSVIPKLGHSFKDGACEVCNAEAPTAAVTLDFTTGDQADSPYLIEVAGHNGSSSSGYIKLDSNGKLVFKAPGAGKVVFTFTDDNNSQSKAVAINGTEKTLPDSEPTLEVETTANQEITMVRSSNTQPRVTGLTWTPADEGGEEETKVAEAAVNAILAAINEGATGEDATAEAANFAASQGDLDLASSDADTLKDFVADALKAKMGTKADEVTVTVDTATYTPNAAATLLADGEVKVGDIAYEATVANKENATDTATIKGTIAVMAADEGGDDPTPAQTVWTFENAKLNKAVDGYPFEGEENKFEGLTFHNVTSQNDNNTVTNKPFALLAKDSTISVPVSGKCDVEVTYNYAANATVGVGSNTVTTVVSNSTATTGTNPAVYHNGDENATAVVITGLGDTTYVEKIEIKAYTAPTPVVSVPGDAKDTVIAGTATAEVQATVQNATSATWTVTSGTQSVATASVDTSGKVTVTGVATGKSTITVTATVDGTGYSDSFTVWVKPATAGKIAAGEYSFGTKDAYYLTDGLSWTNLPHGGNPHGPKGSAGAGMTVAVPDGKVATLTVTTCEYGDGLPITCEGATVDNATNTTASGDNTNASKLTVITNVTGDATVTFGAGTDSKGVYVHTLKVELADQVVVVDLSGKTVTLKKGDAELTAAPVVGDVLTASVEGVNAADVDFIWTVGGTEITANKNATYTVAAADMGKVIKVKAQAKADSTTYEKATPEVSTSTVVGKTMTVSAGNVNTVYDGSAKSITVTGAPVGATIEYSTDGTTWSSTAPTFTNVTATTTVNYRVTAEGYETATGSATITITKKAAPNNITLEADTSEIEATGGTVTFTLKNIPADATVAPVGKCSEKPDETFTFTKQADGTYKGENVVAASTGEAKTHKVTVTWEDTNYVKVEKTMTLNQLATGAIKATPATGLAAWDGLDYAGMGATAAVSGQTVTLTIDEAKILAAYAADPDTFKSGSMNHGGNAYMMIQFEAPADVTTAWTVKQTVNGGAESAEWKLDGTGGDLDCWTAGDKLMIGDWFGILMGVEGAAQSMPAVDTYVLRYNFYDNGEMKAAVTYTVDRQVVKAATVTLVANTDLDDVTVPAKVSPVEDFELTVAVKDAATKVLPNTITVKKNGTAMAASDYTWDQATGKLTIAAAKLAPEDAIEITITPANKPADKTALNAAITAATEKKTGVETSADGTDIAKNKTWVTEAVMNALNEKLTAAQNMADKADATQTEVDAAKDALVAATEAFVPAAGTKEEGGENPPVVEDGVYILDANDLEVTANTVELSGAKWGTDGFFEVCSTQAGKPFTPATAASFEGKEWDKTITMGGAFSYNSGDPKAALKFTTEKPATVKVWWANAKDTEARNLAIYDSTGTLVVAATASAEGSYAVQNLFIHELDKAGTYYLGSNNSSINIYRVEVAEKDDQGGETVDKTALTAAITAAEALADVVGSADGKDVETTKEWVETAKREALDTALTEAKALGDDATQEQVTAAAEKLAAAVKDVTDNKKAGLKDEGGENPPAVNTALADAIKAAQKLVDETYESEDGTDVSTRNEWVTEEVMQALKDAITEAKKVGADATEEEVEAAKTALADAVKTFEDAKQPGSKRVVSGGGTSSSTPVTTNKTETKDDGTTVTTTTDKNGTTTVVTKRPDGMETTTVTDKNGDMTITTVNDKDEVVAEVKIPATIPANAQKFVDVPEGHWAEGSINHMAALEMVKGVDDVNHIFDMNSAITRGAVATILYRFSNGEKGLSQSFSDVAEGEWYTDGVAWASTAGVVNGYENGTFQPNASITREQLAVMIYRYAKIIGLDVSGKGDLTTFTDGVKVQSWAVDGMAWCVKNGIINGRGDGTVDPGTPATRAEAAAMLDRFVSLLK